MLFGVQSLHACNNNTPKYILHLLTHVKRIILFLMRVLRITNNYTARFLLCGVQSYNTHKQKHRWTRSKCKRCHKLTYWTKGQLGWLQPVKAPLRLLPSLYNQIQRCIRRSIWTPFEWNPIEIEWRGQLNIRSAAQQCRFCWSGEQSIGGAQKRSLRLRCWWAKPPQWCWHRTKTRR